MNPTSSQPFLPSNPRALCKISMSLRVAMGEVPTTLYFHSPVLVDKIEFLGKNMKIIMKVSNIFTLIVKVMQLNRVGINEKLVGNGL
jgi:hypothetical protein